MSHIEKAAEYHDKMNALFNKVVKPFIVSNAIVLFVMAIAGAALSAKVIGNGFIAFGNDLIALSENQITQTIAWPILTYGWKIAAAIFVASIIATGAVTLYAERTWPKKAD